MPLNIDIVQVLLHMLNFVILAGGLTLILFKPVRKFIDERQKRFEEQERVNRETAEENARLREEYTARLRELDEETAAARRQAEKEAADIAKAYIDSSRAEAAAIIAKAEEDAEKRKEQILDSAQTEIGELVIGAAQKLLGDTATPERTEALYDSFLKEAEKKTGRQDDGKNAVRKEKRQ